MNHNSSTLGGIRDLYEVPQQIYNKPEQKKRKSDDNGLPARKKLQAGVASTNVDRQYNAPFAPMLSENAAYRNAEEIPAIGSGVPAVRAEHEQHASVTLCEYLQKRTTLELHVSNEIKYCYFFSRMSPSKATPVTQTTFFNMVYAKFKLKSDAKNEPDLIDTLTQRRGPVNVDHTATLRIRLARDDRISFDYLLKKIRHHFANQITDSVVVDGLKCNVELEFA